MRRVSAYSWYFLVAIALAPLLVIACDGQSDAAESLKPLLEVLAKDKTSASLEFTGRCESLWVGAYPEFPRLGMPATNEKNVLDEVRYLFKDNHEINVSQDAEGTIRIVQYGVATDILNIWLGSISFGTANVYGANQALAYVMAAPEVKRYMTAQNVESPYAGAAVDILMGTKPPPESTPHISGSLTNVSVSQALDRLLKVFQGVWIYENCPATDKQGRIAYLRFYRLQATGRGEVVQ